MSLRSAIATYAPWGHAWLFSRTGDFARTQPLLEQALYRGFRGNRRNYFTTSSSRTCLKTIGRFLDEIHVEAAASTAEMPKSSFHGSPKVQAMERAVETLRSYPEKERMALVLIYVDEVPPERVAEWLEIDAGAIAELRTRFEGTVEPGAIERLSNFKLSEAFLAGVLSRIEQGGESSVSLGRVFLWMLLLSIGAAGITAGRDFGLLGILSSLGIWGLACGVAAVAGLCLVQWWYSESMPSTIWRAETGWGRVCLEVLTFTMLPLVWAHGVLVFAPGLLVAKSVSRRFWMANDSWPLALGLLLLEILAVYTLVSRFLPSVIRAVVGSRFRHVETQPSSKIADDEQGS